MWAVSQMSKAETRAVVETATDHLFAEVLLLNTGEGLAAGRFTVMELTAQKFNDVNMINRSNLRKWYS